MSGTNYINILIRRQSEISATLQSMTGDAQRRTDRPLMKTIWPKKSPSGPRISNKSRTSNRNIDNLQQRSLISLDRLLDERSPTLFRIVCHLMNQVYVSLKSCFTPEQEQSGLNGKESEALEKNRNERPNYGRSILVFHLIKKKKRFLLTQPIPLVIEIIQTFPKH